MKYYVVNYLDYVDILRAEYHSSSLALKVDDREDESVLYKVRANICDIFYKMAGATDRKVTAMNIDNEAEEVRKFNEEFLDLFEKIPMSWKTSLARAQKFNDAVTVKTEEVKLETANILREKFIKIIGDANLKKDSKVIAPILQGTASSSALGGLKS